MRTACVYRDTIHTKGIIVDKQPDVPIVCLFMSILSVSDFICFGLLPVDDICNKHKHKHKVRKFSIYESTSYPNLLLKSVHAYGGNMNLTNLTNLILRLGARRSDNVSHR